VTIWLFCLVSLAVAGSIAWAFANGHPGIAIAVMVLVYIVPGLVTTALSIRQSRQRAQAARRTRSSRPT
jgi:uncharacterized membrane protein YqjE